MKMRFCGVSWVAMSVAAAVVLGICCGFGHAAEKAVRIGFAFTMTGGSAAYGATQNNGARLAVDRINSEAGSDGVKIVPIFDDDAGLPQQGVNVFQRFINADKVSLIIGPTLSNTAKVTDPVAQRAGVPVLAISNTAEGITEIGDFIFRNSLPEAVVIPNTLTVVAPKLGIKKAALLYGNDDAFTKAGYDAFKDALQKQGVEVLSEETFAKGDHDFSPQLTRIKSRNPDAVIVSALVEEASGIVTQARRLDIPASVRIIGGNGFNSPALIKNAGDAAEGIIVGASWNATSSNPLNRGFVEAYTAKYGSEPDQFAAQAYAGVCIAYEAVRRAGGSGDGKEIRDALAGIRDFDTVLGKFSFTEGRDADYPPVVQEVKGGRFVVFGD